MPGSEAQRIAVVGAGVSGLVAAYLLGRRHEVVLFEAAERLGGHTHTLTVDDPVGPLAVDTGFIVFNPDHYPLFSRLLERLGVDSQPSDMSFSVRDEASGLEWAGSPSLNTVFGQRRNLLRPSFWRMLREIVRFGREARSLLAGRIVDSYVNIQTVKLFARTERLEIRVDEPILIRTGRPRR